jgi:rubrerythrin
MLDTARQKSTAVPGIHTFRTLAASLTPFNRAWTASSELTRLSSRTSQPAVEATMTEETGPRDRETQLPQAYGRMLERIRTALGRAENSTLPRLQEWIAEAKDRAVELGELTREEAEHVGDYLRRDVVDAADYLTETGRELKDWLRFDLALVEDRLHEVFSSMVDQTRLELDRLADEARNSDQLSTGEVTGFGTLRCLECGIEIEFTEPAGIPPCPRCGATRFVRVSA